MGLRLESSARSHPNDLSLVDSPNAVEASRQADDEMIDVVVAERDDETLPLSTAVVHPLRMQSFANPTSTVDERARQALQVTHDISVGGT